MNEEILKELVGETVSVLLALPKFEGGEKRETYNGIIEDVKDGVLILNTNNPKFSIKKLFVKTDLIISVWVYDREKYKEWQDAPK